MADLVARLRHEGRTLDDRLDELAERHGLHLSASRSYRFDGLDGPARRAAAMAALRAAPPEALVSRMRVDHSIILNTVARAGDPVANLFRGRNLSEEQRERLQKQFGLDGSMGTQFVAYVKQTATLNFGRTYTTNEPVASEIARKAGPTIALVGVATLLSAIFGVLGGIAAAWRRRTKTDYSVTTFTMATYSMPDFWLGMLLLSVFATSLGLFPVGGIVDPNSDATGVAKLVDQAQHMFLPALTLTLAYLGEYALVMRSSLIDTMREDYLILARAKGLRDILVRNRHAVPNALLPVVTLIAINFGLVLGGDGRRHAVGGRDLLGPRLHREVVGREDPLDGREPHDERLRPPRSGGGIDHQGVARQPAVGGLAPGHAHAVDAAARSEPTGDPGGERGRVPAHRDRHRDPRVDIPGTYRRSTHELH